MRNFQFRLAQVAFPKIKREALAAVIDAHELPGAGWTVMDARSWRTGALGAPTEESKRARLAGSITAIKSFEQSRSSRWTFVEVIPFASADDAETMLPKLKDGFLANPRAEVSVTQEGWVEGVELPPDLFALAYEQLTIGNGRPGSTKYLFARASNTALVVCCSAFDDSWTWEEVGAIGVLQADRLGM
jgi:hypothetical protein